MDPRCDYCGISRALVYCKSHLAKLCLNCDGCVHSANPLSRRHPRSLICEKCFSQSAVIRCLDEKLSLCQGCHWTSNGSCSGHHLQSLSPYSGCPSSIEFSKIWSSLLEPSGSTSDPGRGWISSYYSLNSGPDQRDHSDGLLGMPKTNGLDSCIGSSSSVIPHNICYTQNLRDQSSFFYDESNVPKGCSDANLNLDKEEDICEGLNMDDVPLNFDAGEDIIACSQSQSQTSYNQYEDTEPDCLLVDKNSSVTESNCPIENTLEASSSKQQDCNSTSYKTQQVFGLTRNPIRTMNGDSNMITSSTCGRNLNMGIPLPPPQPASTLGQTHGSMSLSLSNTTGESSASDYRDCELSSGILMGDSTWESNVEVSCPQARDRAKMRYRQKKSKRTFGKQIRYASRKARADTRKRVKGRFVKAGDAYDYDPLVEDLQSNQEQRQRL